MKSKVIIVTGGNRGIGNEIVKQLSDQGHQLILAARSKNKGLNSIKSIEGTVDVMELDVSDPKSIKNFYRDVVNKYKRVDVLINNAGIISGNEGLVNSEIREIRRVMETNFFGPMQLNSFFIPQLKNSNDGRIINISSGMGALNDLSGGYAGYRLSKAGLNAQTILLANELSGTNVKVNAMCPGWVRTDMGGSSADRSVDKGAETAVWLATAKNIPTGKFLRDKKVIPW